MLRAWRCGFVAGLAAAAATAFAVTTARADDAPALVDLATVRPDVVVEMRYATARNFLKRVLYDFDRCLLTPDAARRLAAVQEALRKDGLGLKVWDCYRPRRVQWELWKVMPVPGYVADPREGSNHNRGAAVDVTLVDATGRERAMPTDHDFFGERAHHGYGELSAEVKTNRERLRAAMEAAGFTAIRTEWWHYDVTGAAALPVLDVEPASVPGPGAAAGAREAGAGTDQSRTRTSK